MVLPLLFWLSDEHGCRRHEGKTRQELSRAFSDAWRLYKSHKKTPFRNGFIGFRSAVTQKHVLDKLFPALAEDNVLIYLYASRLQCNDGAEATIGLADGSALNLKSLIERVDAESKGCSVIFLDVPGAASALRNITLENSALVCRSARDFLRPTPTGSDPLSSAFARYFGAAIRHMPVFSFRDLIDAISIRVKGSREVRGKLFEVIGNAQCLEERLSRFFPEGSPISGDEVANLQSENPGSFEDGLQSIWGVIDKPEQFDDASSLAEILRASSRFPNAKRSARFLKGRETQHPIFLSEDVPAAPVGYVRGILERMIYVPGGTAVLGSDPEKDKYALSQEIPEHLISHKSFALSAYHITVGEWLVFQGATGSLEDFDFSAEELNHPKRYVNFFDACRFADWIDRSAKVHELIEPDSRIMLPSEAEWEIAARGRQGNIYPWGDEFLPFCNFRDNSNDTVCAVGTFSPKGDSPFGFKDMAGNVWEWTRSLWGESGRRPEFCYPYEWNDGRENLLAYSNVRRVVRGGAYYYFDWCLRCATRNVMFPDTRHSGGGFRLLKSSASGAEVFPVVAS